MIHKELIDYKILETFDREDIIKSSIPEGNIFASHHDWISILDLEMAKNEYEYILLNNAGKTYDIDIIYYTDIN